MANSVYIGQLVALTNHAQEITSLFVRTRPILQDIWSSVLSKQI